MHFFKLVYIFMSSGKVRIGVTGRFYLFHLLQFDAALSIFYLLD